MNIIFLRHGEAIDNVKKLISDKEIYWSVLTESGKNTVVDSISGFSNYISKIYVSPFPRTLETANYVWKKYSDVEVVIDSRIREIYHGKYSHKENNSDLDNVRLKQISGDYFVRLGDYGENNFDIESRLCNFLKDVYKNNMKYNTVMIVTHGSITSYMKRILKIKTAHIQTGKMEVFKDVDFKPLFIHIKKLNKIKKEKILARVNRVNSLNISKSLTRKLLKLAKDEFNNIEFNEEMFNGYIEGLKTKNLKQITSAYFSSNIILVCFYNNFQNFADFWMKHYISIGIRNFVLIDNNSSDSSTDILKKYANVVNISFWKIEEHYDCDKMCGWRQQIFEFYGTNKIYLTVDSDELFIYKNYKTISIDEFIKHNKFHSVKALMLDVYSKSGLYKGMISEFKYVDKESYYINSSVSYGQRFYGGPRSRVLNINPSLQKIPMIRYTGTELFINDHFYYPFNLNNNSKFISYLLHYKFLFEDYKKYLISANDERHWNNSQEYKAYCGCVKADTSFYDDVNSILIDDIKFDFK